METKRLILRELNPKDAINLYKLNLNTDVIRYTGDVAFESIEAAKKFIEHYDHYKKHGFGRWAVIVRENKEFIGWCGLKYSEEKKEIDLGFRFLKKHWNKGYATEAAKLCVQLAFSKFGIPEIIGRAQTRNKASHRVLQKIGMKHRMTTQINNENWEIYSIKKPIL